jgi:AcrR family transcriptional regulator
MRLRDENKEIAVRSAALKMIVKEGFMGMSMQKLAKEAGVSPGTIYIYFQDQQDLLNKLYIEVMDRTNAAALVNFDPLMNFDEGLKLLWMNRYRYYVKHPDDFHFIEQFVNSPLIKQAAEQEDATYRKQMKIFYNNAVNKQQVMKLPLEVYWPVAYAPLYQLIRFRLQESIHPKPNFVVTEKKLLSALELVLKALSV